MLSDIAKGLEEKIEKNSPTLDRSASYTKKSKITRLPAYLAVNFVRFQWKPEINAKAKILKVRWRRRTPDNLMNVLTVRDRVESKVSVRFGYDRVLHARIATEIESSQAPNKGSGRTKSSGKGRYITMNVSYDRFIFTPAHRKPRRPNWTRGHLMAKRWRLINLRPLNRIRRMLLLTKER